MQEREPSSTPLKLLRMRDLKSEYGLAAASVHRWISEGSFPLPVNLGSNSVAWYRTEVEIWLQSRPRAKVKQQAASSQVNAEIGGWRIQLLTYATRAFLTNFGAQPKKRASSFLAGSKSMAHSR